MHAVDRVWLQPLESAEARNSLAVGLGRTYSARVTGSTVDTSEQPVLLQLTVRAHGALVHRQLEHLCRLHINDTSGHVSRSAMRRCRHFGSGRFEAHTLFYLPKDVPTRHLGLPLAATDDAAAQSSFEASWALASDELSQSFPAQVARWEMRVLFHAFRRAVRSLPLPFTILESGNLCAQSTIFIARLKRDLCPVCQPA